MCIVENVVDEQWTAEWKLHYDICRLNNCNGNRTIAMRPLRIFPKNCRFFRAASLNSNINYFLHEKRLLRRNLYNNIFLAIFSLPISRGGKEEEEQGIYLFRCFRRQPFRSGWTECHIEFKRQQQRLATATATTMTTTGWRKKKTHWNGISYNWLDEKNKNERALAHQANGAACVVRRDTHTKYTQHKIRKICVCWT